MRLLSKKLKYARTDIWREGKWLDLWSVVHVFSGLLVGFSIYLLHMDAVLGTMLAAVVLIAYELFEIYAEIEEAPTNRFMDVVVGMVGYVPAFFLISPILTSEDLVLTFVLLLVLNSALSIAGWHASQKALDIEKHLRTRLAADRQRLKERSKRFRSKHHF